MTLEEKIKAELKKRGLDENLVGEIKVEKEDDIEQAVYDYKLQVKLEESLKKEKDQAVTKALKTREENLKAEFEEEKKKMIAEF